MTASISGPAQEYRQGTQRAIPPEETLSNVLPLLARCGITRVLEVTELDRLGVPTYNAVRPNGLFLSVSNGKGRTNAAARVSAIMESAELQHAEYPDTSSWRLSTGAGALREEGLRAVDPRLILRDCLWPSDAGGGFYYSDDLILDWVAGTDLIADAGVMLPAAAIYVRPPFTHYFNTNGLASGNTFAEAVLHAVFEVVERDAVAGLVGRTKDSPPLALRRVDLTSLPTHLANLAEQVASAGIELFLISLPTSIPIFTFWAIFYCPGEPPMLSSSVGYGAHSDPAIAASRAITEAAQARLTNIHGAREDLEIERVQLAEARSRAFGKFRRLSCHEWSELMEISALPPQGLGIEETLEAVLGMLERSGRKEVFVHDLTRRDIGISVAKVFIPGMKLGISFL